ncbi:FtsX-like permease family protein [Dactylosporangium sp. NPDC048998]|uniref:FtsX-like permease family protein n=1 Tax=Dactylosporangium sp. NPDC048998 TaxID=3363976 RepID=UPI00372264F8
MGRLRLVLRLARRDLRRRPFEAALVLLVLAAATTTLSLGLTLRGVTDRPYERTKAASAGPDAIAGFVRDDGAPLEPGAVDELAAAPGVTAHGGPFRLLHTTMTAGGRTVTVEAEGRDALAGQQASAVDQPMLVDGGWVRPGEVVVERGFAEATGVRVGDAIGLGGRTFRVGGIAVGSALPAYPSSLCHIFCFAGVAPGPGAFDIGLVWLTDADAGTLATTTPTVLYLVGLRLSDPAAAPAFAAAHDTRPGPGVAAPFVLSWQEIRDADSGLVRTEQAALQVGAGLLALLAVAGLAVLAGRRMVEQTRRVGLLKAVGGSPGLIAGVLLVEHLALALGAAAAGLLAGRLLAPSLAAPGAGLVGAPDAPALTPGTVAAVVGAALACALAATAGPALRAARTSTVAALRDPARRPRRSPALIAVSARLPVPLLLGLRLVARRPSRAVLLGISTAVTVTGLTTILTSATVTSRYAAGVHNLRAERLGQVTATLTVMLLVLAAVNTVFMTWATVTDARHASALARALGATPARIGAGLSVVQVLPAAIGALAGLPLGVQLYRAATGEGAVAPPWWQLVLLPAATVLGVLALTAVPSLLGARRPVAAVLRTA